MTIHVWCVYLYQTFIIHTFWYVHMLDVTTSYGRFSGNFNVWYVISLSNFHKFYGILVKIISTCHPAVCNTFWCNEVPDVTASYGTPSDLIAFF